MSWTLRYLLDNWGRLTPGSLVRYRDFLLREAAGRLREGELLSLRMRHPISGDIWIREKGSDYYTFKEIIHDEVYRPIIRNLRDCRFIVDIGANIGLATRYFAHFYPNGSFCVVEPDQGNFRVLERNIGRLAREGRCRALRNAVWDRGATVAIEMPGGGSGSYDSYYATEYDQDDSDRDPSQLVEAMTIEEILRTTGFPRIDLLKVDVEGAEARLFDGDLGWLGRIGTIAIEFHGGSRAESGFDEAMRRFEFSVREPNAHTVIASKAY